MADSTPNVFVIDCSVAAKWILPEPGRDAALRLLERYETGEILLIAPNLLLAEFASLLAKRCRRKEMSEGQAERAFDLMQNCAPRLFDVHRRIRAALMIALQCQLSLWDCLYIELALEYNAPSSPQTSGFSAAELRVMRPSASCAKLGMPQFTATHSAPAPNANPL